jgi:Flp pilus assembly pilin Flp
MLRILALLERFRSDKRAVTALEYGLIAAVLGTVIITAFTSLGSGLTKAIGTVTASLTNAAG